MDLLPLSSYNIATTLVINVALLVFLYFLTWILKKYVSRRKFGAAGERTIRRAPLAAGAWPIIGHLHLLGGSAHVTLGAMADKHGPIFMIKLGIHNVLVVSDSTSAKECFTINDKVFATRPKSVAVEVMGYNYAMFPLTQYGPYWREVRKIAVVELLSGRRLEILREIRVSEVRSSMKDMEEFWFKISTDQAGSSSNMVKMEMSQWFGNLIQNIVVKMIAGKRYSPEEEEAIRFQKTVRKFFELLGAFTVSDAIPYLRWLDLGGHEKEMKAVAKDMDEILQGWLLEHKRKKNSSEVLTTYKRDQQDFMDVIISIVEDDLAGDRFPGFDPDTTIKANSLALIIAASDTSSVSLTWALSLLLNHPQAMEKAQQELDLHVGRERRVEESDVKNLVYLQAIIKESMRTYPAVPLAVPHESMEDCVVGGYHIPKGTRLLPNIWKIQHDDRVWQDPYEFRPERFLTSHKDIDLRGQDFDLIPFGSGRRMCPGMSFALQTMQLTLASLIQGFEVAKPSDEAIDMTVNFGLTVMKATPLEILFRPRLSPDLYHPALASIN